MTETARSRAVIAEVSNTFGDRHSYLCAHGDHRPLTREDTLSAQKIFHVSPFQPIEGGYTFRFDIRADRIGGLDRLWHRERGALRPRSRDAARP